MLIDETHDPAAESWVPGADGHTAFPVQNLPYGIFSTGSAGPRPGVAIGDHILDLACLAGAGYGLEEYRTALSRTSLNDVMALPPAERLALRRLIFSALTDKLAAPGLSPHLYPSEACALHLPARIGDYTDFYAGINHALNVGRLFRPDNPLLPNYKHVPIGYHGRASSICVSGGTVVRPCGQQKPAGSDMPIFGRSQRLDYELELGIWIGEGSALGGTVPLADASRHIAGFCLLNDWSARDIQAWEYQPLGPFLAKNFHTTISPWVVSGEALAPFRVAQPPRPQGDPRPLPYLFDEADQLEGALSLMLEVHLRTAAMRKAGVPPHRLSRGPATSLYWTVAQLVTHHASNGCNLNPGDLLGTGTISAETPDGWGSLLEITRGGTEPVLLPTGERRMFLEDGDEISLSAVATAEGYASIGFGPCRATLQSGT